MDRGTDQTDNAGYNAEDAKADRIQHLAHDLISFRKDLDVSADELFLRAMNAFQSPNKYFVSDDEWRAMIKGVGDIKKLVNERVHEIAVIAHQDLGMSTREVGEMLDVSANTVSRWARKEKGTPN